MATTAARPEQTGANDDGILQLIDLDLIQADRNVRELADEDVAALAGSIELLGQITPAIVRPVEEGDGFVLVAGHKRYAALRSLGRTQIRAEVRSAAAEHSERAAENIVSCRRRHETINADHDGMPTNRRAGRDARRTSDATSA
jgi:hypothetical protein